MSGGENMIIIPFLTNLNNELSLKQYVVENSLALTPIGITFQQPKRSCRIRGIPIVPRFPVKLSAMMTARDLSMQPSSPVRVLSKIQPYPDLPGISPENPGWIFYTYSTPICMAALFEGTIFSEENQGGSFTIRSGGELARFYSAPSKSLHGRYKYSKASNTSQESWFIEPFERVRFIKEPQDTMVTLGDQLTLFCEVNTRSEADITWYNNDKEVSWSTTVDCKGAVCMTRDVSNTIYCLLSGMSGGENMIIIPFLTNLNNELSLKQYVVENSLALTPIGITFQQPKRSCRRENGVHGIPIVPRFPVKLSVMMTARDLSMQPSSPVRVLSKIQPYPDLPGISPENPGWIFYTYSTPICMAALFEGTIFSEENQGGSFTIRSGGELARFYSAPSKSLHGRYKYSKASNTSQESWFIEPFERVRFIKEPQDTMVTLGDQLTLFCEVNTRSEADITWYNNDKEVSWSTTVDCKGAVCMVRFTDKSHAGSWQCKVQTEQSGTLMSRYADVEVAYFNRTFVYQPRDGRSSYLNSYLKQTICQTKGPSFV
eukprot:sb/3463659/